MRWYWTNLKGQRRYVHGLAVLPLLFVIIVALFLPGVLTFALINALSNHGAAWAAAIIVTILWWIHFVNIER